MKIASKSILAVWAFAVFCVGLTAAVLLRESGQSFERATSDRHLLLTRNRAVALRDNLELAASELERVSERRKLDLADRDPEQERRVVRHAWSQSPFFNGGVRLVGRDGRCAWAEPDPTDCDGEEDASGWLRRARAADGVSVTYVSEEDGTGVVSIAVPIRRGDVRPEGWLRGIVELERDRMLSPALAEELPPGTRVLLTSDDGTEVYVSPGVDSRASVYRGAVEAVRRGESGTARASAGDRELLVAWSPVGYGGLGLVFSWPWERLDDPREAELRHLALLVAIVTALALATGYATSRMITRPIVDLADQVRQAGMNPEAIPVGSRRGDEIGDLQRAFRDMIDRVCERDRRIQDDMTRIAELASTLEQRVEERTAELRAAQASLVDKERLAAIGEAGAALSHELRNSLNAISVGVDMLARDSGTESAKQAARQEVRGEVTRLRTLADDLLAFARDPGIAARECQPMRIAERAVAIAEEHAAANGVDISLEGEIATTASLDPDRVQSVLVNLLRNAVDAAASGASAPRRARLSVSIDGPELVFRVEDSGEGVAEQVRQRMFQPFVTTKRTGVGLGLATAERITRAHGGRLRLGAGELGGACFEVRIPVEGGDGES